MASEPSPIPASFRYQEALSPLTKLTDDERLRKKLSELLALLDFNSTLNRSLELSEILDLVLFVAMGETRASWAAVLLRDSKGALRPVARRGRSDDRWAGLVFQAGDECPATAIAGVEEDEMSELAREILSATRAQLLVPMVKSERLIGLLLLGERDRSYGEDERLFTETLSVSAAASIDNGRIYEELQRLTRKLSFKVYQLNTLFDITRELNRSPDVGHVREAVVTTAMGQVLTTRAALVLGGTVVEQRGVKLDAAKRSQIARARRLMDDLEEDRNLDELPEGPLRTMLKDLGMDTVVPLRSGESCHGVLLLGPRASGKSLAKEDRDFLRSLASQGAAALDNLRLTQQWLEKQKIEKEMAIAREIQRGLLPDHAPELPGWDIAGINIPCLTVGGDYFDYLPRAQGKYWLVIADVSGKGTGPALIMASLQSALTALAGFSEITLEALTRRLNELVYNSTETNKYVTAFFGSLDTNTGELYFVNAGHCYPLLLRETGELDRLVQGGPVIGLFPEFPHVEVGKMRLRKNDVLLLYTDGLSETTSPEGEEFEESRIIEALKASQDRTAQQIVGRLVSGVRAFAAEAGLSDDLTLMVVKRT